MKRLLLLPLLLLTTGAWAQHTLVTAQVMDSTGALYTNCSGSVSFIGQNTTPGAGPYLLGGSVFQTVVPFQCGSSAMLAVTVADNAAVSPGPSQWNFTVCAPSGLSPGGVPPPICFNLQTTITGPTQDITLALQAVAPVLPTIGGGGITGPTPNGGLVQTGTTLGLITTCTNGQILSWNLVSWGCYTPTGGSGTITGVLTASGSGLMGGGVSGTLNLSLSTSCSINQVQQWNGSAWICANTLSSWSGLTPPTANLALSLSTGGTPYTSIFTEGDFGASPSPGIWTITDNSTTSTDKSYDFLVAVPATSYHHAAAFSVDGFNQLQVCSNGAAHVGIVVVGSAITCPNLSTSPVSKVWMMDSSGGTRSTLTLYQDSLTATGNMFRMNTASSGTGFNFFVACSGATPGVDGSCPSGNNVAILRGDGQLSVTNLTNLAGTGVALNGVTLSGAPISTNQCPTSTSTTTATWQTCGTGGGGGTGAQFQSAYYSAANVLGAYGPGIANQSAISQGGSLPPIFASAGVPGGNGGTGFVSAATYTEACDSGTKTRDRLTTIIFTAATPTLTVPDAGSSGCGSNFAFWVGAATGTTLTVQQNTTSTFTTVNGTAYATGLTSFTLTDGQYASISSPDNVNYIARIVSGIGASWSALQNPTGSLVLAMGTNNTTFNSTSGGMLFQWANTTAATGSVSQASPTLQLIGEYWNGSATGLDYWAIQNIPSNGTNAATTLSLAHTSGTSGAANVQVPSLTIGSGGMNLSNSSGTLLLGANASLTSAGALTVASCTGCGGGGGMAISALTGSTAAASITETGATFAITFEGIETANLTYPYVFTNTNSTASRTSGALILQTTGTDTSQVPLLINEATAAGPFVNFINGGTVTAGVESGGTSEYQVSATGGVTQAGGLILTGAQGAATTISTTTTNANLIFTPNGTGSVVVPAGSATQAGVTFTGANTAAGLGYITTNAFGFTNGSQWGTKFYPSGIAIPTGSWLSWSTGSSANNAVDTCLDHPSSGILRLDANTSCNDGKGKFQAAGFQSTGTTFTSNAGCTDTVLAGGATAGKFTVGTSSTCTTIVTMGNSLVGSNGWACSLHDLTTPATVVSQTATTIATASFTLTTPGSGDVVNFACTAY